MKAGVFLTTLTLALSGCASDYVARTHQVRRAYQDYDHSRALKKLEQEAEKGPENDRLLALMDQGMVLHAAGQYQESIRVLAEAEKRAESLEIVSVSEEAATLLANERQRAYRGEDFERLMISTLQALNYAKLGAEEDALVEVRRVNERLQKMIAEEKKPYEQLAVARYLGGVLYEDQGEWDSAFIDYQKAQELEPSLGHLAEPLLRLAKKTGRDDAYRALRSRYPEVGHQPIGAQEGEVVVVVEAGLSPEKVPDQTRRTHRGEVELIAIPRFRDRGHPPRASVQGGGIEISAVTVTSLARVAKVHLDDRIGRLIARALAGTALKAGLAAGAGALTKSEGVGALTFLLLNLANQPDLRSWLSLPAEFQLARLRLPAGKHSLTVEVGGHRVSQEVEVRPRRLSLLVVRAY